MNTGLKEPEKAGKYTNNSKATAVCAQLAGHCCFPHLCHTTCKNPCVIQSDKLMSTASKPATAVKDLMKSLQSKWDGDEPLVIYASGLFSSRHSIPSASIKLSSSPKACRHLVGLLLNIFAAENSWLSYYVVTRSKILKSTNTRSCFLDVSSFWNSIADLCLSQWKIFSVNEEKPHENRDYWFCLTQALKMEPRSLQE